jgi:hypothetical protein
VDNVDVMEAKLLCRKFSLDEEEDGMTPLSEQDTALQKLNNNPSILDPAFFSIAGNSKGRLRVFRV